jgi:hypothetical protein
MLWDVGIPGKEGSLFDELSASLIFHFVPLYLIGTAWEGAVLVRRLLTMVVAVDEELEDEGEEKQD